MHVLTIPDPSLVLMVGPAGSGKSTLAGRLFDASEILSSDALREAVSGDARDQSASRSAFAFLHRELARRLGMRQLTVVDATNVRREHRRPLVRAAMQRGLSVSAIVLDLPDELVRRRNAARDRVVGGEVLDRQLGWLRRTVDGDQLAAEDVGPIIILRDADDAATMRIVRIPPTSRLSPV